MLPPRLPVRYQGPAVIAFRRTTVPVPDGIALRIGRQLPARVQAAIGQAADAGRLLHLCRGARYEEARQVQQARIAAANKVLAAYNPKLIHGWADLDWRNR